MGILGIYGLKWRRIASSFKGFLALEERSEGRRAYYYTHAEKKELGKIQSLVAKHKVTPALRGIDKWIHDVSKAIDKEVKLGMSQIFQYFHILKITKHFVDMLGRFIDHANTRPKGDSFRERVDKLAQNILQKMIAAVEQAEAWGGEDVRTIMAIINDSKEKKPALFMADIRKAFKYEENISILGRIPLRMDIRAELRDEKSLEALSHKLEALDKRLQAGNKQNYNQMLGEFERVVFKGSHDLFEMFKAAHLIMKRDLLLIIMVLADERVIGQLGTKWVQIHFMPDVPVHQRLMKIEEINKKLSEKAHTLANGLGVIVKGERSVEQELKRELDRAA